LELRYGSRGWPAGPCIDPLKEEELAEASLDEVPGRTPRRRRL